eukprot:7272149-Pyramimonas_sp.AAC.8
MLLSDEFNTRCRRPPPILCQVRITFLLMPARKRYQDDHPVLEVATTHHPLSNIIPINVARGAFLASFSSYYNMFKTGARWSIVSTYEPKDEVLVSSPASSTTDLLLPQAPLLNSAPMYPLRIPGATEYID